MGGGLGKMFGTTRWFNRKHRRVLILGLDAAGKTTLLSFLSLGKATETVPTVGFNYKKVKFGGLKLNIWDVGGQDKVRVFWRHYYLGTQGIVYVVDSSDLDRIALAKKELDAVLVDVQLEGVPLLVLANKTDLPEALSKEEVSEHLGLSQLNRPWHIQATVAKSGLGIQEALLWLKQAMKPL
eukprot:GILJ01001340.1.p1 GENE.GILJ01001340.1~~GILJ01001340.1.p1  ORF type:complete len:182 (-),score=12.77 GILJ01001340.1:235-780(-)